MAGTCDGRKVNTAQRCASNAVAGSKSRGSWKAPGRIFQRRTSHAMMLPTMGTHITINSVPMSRVVEPGVAHCRIAAPATATDSRMTTMSRRREARVDVCAGGVGFEGGVEFGGVGMSGNAVRENFEWGGQTRVDCEKRAKRNRKTLASRASDHDPPPEQYVNERPGRGLFSGIERGSRDQNS
ncbi:hypothetical protein VARIO8X_60614 [Burkholderiales bacterium 8X]|nr:hypothetical protein VARIO8X_60614 [Burkholderiales bacterium 8X]